MKKQIQENLLKLEDYRGTTLKEAFRACDGGPLMGKDLERYYVDLSEVRNQAINNITWKIKWLEAGEFSTISFTGHRGCGKTTELRRIQSELEQEYKVIYIIADEEIDLNNAQYTDLYLVIIKKIADELYKLGLKFDPKLLYYFESWFKDITKETEQTVEKAVSLGTIAEAGHETPFVSKILTTIQTQLKVQIRQSTTIREILQRNFERLKTNINLLLEDAFEKLRTKYPQYSKGFLLIFDNLDRVPPHVGQHLFSDYAPQLIDLKTTIIYTAPISIFYSRKGLSPVFGNSYLMPMINLYHFDHEQWDLDYDEKRVNDFAKIIEKRVNIEKVFDSRQGLIDLVKASGGHLRQLMAMTARAFLTAGSRDHEKVMAEDVMYAINQEKFNFERMLLNEYYPILAQVCLNKDIGKDEVGQRLLFNLSVLEYERDDNQGRWNYINPVLRETEGFGQAINAVIKQ